MNVAADTDGPALRLVRVWRSIAGSRASWYACLALGMAGQSSFARALASFLLDEDPFTRLCAYESLRRLTKKDVAIDWMYAPSDERFRGAEEYLKWFLEQER